MAVDENGLVADARADSGQPYLMSSIKAQMRAMLSRANDICARAGASLDNIVRIQHFHTDLRELLPALEVWQEFAARNAAALYRRRCAAAHARARRLGSPRSLDLCSRRTMTFAN